MGLPSIELIDVHICDGAGEVDADEDGTYGYVLINGGTTADTCNSGRDVWRLQES